MLKTQRFSCGQHGWSIPFSGELKPLIKAKLLQKNPYQNPPGYEFTQLRKIPVGALPLKEFNQVQEPLLFKKLSNIKRPLELAQLLKSLNLKERVIDLWFYQTQLKRILEHCLYYLELKTDSETLYKIGITKRTIEERMVEIRRDLRCHYKNIGRSHSLIFGMISQLVYSVSARTEEDRTFHRNAIALGRCNYAER